MNATLTTPDTPEAISHPIRSWLRTSSTWGLGAFRCLSSQVQVVAIGIIAILDWIVGLVERLVVLAIAFMAFYLGWRALSGASEGQLLKSLSDNWKGLLLLLVPLFYRAVRSFFERVEEAWGMKTHSAAKKSADPVEPEGEGE